jgi:hypothetical protein
MKMVWFDLKEFWKIYERNRKTRKRKGRKQNKNIKGPRGSL